MNALISNPDDCEVRGVIRFLQAENVRPCEIYQRLVAVYGEHVMNAANVRKWCICLRMGEQMFMTLRSQGDPLSSQMRWRKRWTASFERIDISQLAKCMNNVRKCLVQLCTKLSLNICNTAKFVHVGPGGLLVRGGNNKLVSRYDKCLNVQGDYVEK